MNAIDIEDRRAVKNPLVEKACYVDRLTSHITDILFSKFGYQRLLGYNNMHVLGCDYREIMGQENRFSIGYVKTSNTPFRAEDVMIDFYRSDYSPEDYSINPCGVLKVVIRDGNVRLDNVIRKACRDILGKIPKRKEDEFVPDGTFIYPIAVVPNNQNN